MYKQLKNPKNSKVVMDFFRWAYHHGQHDAHALDYVPLPKSLVEQIEDYWRSEYKL